MKTNWAYLSDLEDAMTGVRFDNFGEEFESPNHQKRIANKLFELWKEEKFCDAALAIGSQKVHIHKCVLLASCPYVLKQCLVQNFSTNTFLDVQLPPDVKMEGVRAFVEYLYIGVLRLTSSNVSSVEKIALSLEMKEVCSFCTKFKNRKAEKMSPKYPQTSSSLNSSSACKSSDNDSSMIPTIDSSESYLSMNIKQEPVDDNCDEATSFETDSLTNHKYKNSETVIKKPDTEFTPTKTKNSDISSDDTTDICTLEMEVECEEEPEDLVTDNESYNQSICSFSEQTSHVEAMAAASGDVGTTVQAGGSQVKKEVVEDPQTVILPLIGNDVDAWTSVVNSPQVLNTRVSSQQATKPPLPPKIILLQIPSNFLSTQNISNKQSSEKQPNKTEQPRFILSKKT